ncbi:ATG13 domain-containing protein [Cephalotus follicularis]|uniref:ATG13 domain-containing protein n=1 Tax=Cephalotus follicularis TaxID=3775 RepID=A0A1Q3BMG2_CEPFO|nr:ATG13 domain-containing protein [Cephalotus follicularis]
MDFHIHTSHPDSGKLEQIVSQFLLKSLHIILDSRIPSLRSHDRSGDLSSPLNVRKSDKWFNLVLGGRPAALDNLNFWHRNLLDPMIIDIILVHGGPTSSSVEDLYSNSQLKASSETVIERWVVQYECPQVMGHCPQTNETSATCKKTYKKSIILLRSLHSFMRLLPAHRIFRQLSSAPKTYNLDVIYKVSSFSSAFSRTEEETMQEYCFVPVEALPGRICLSVSYRPTLSSLNLEPSVTLPPKIITDYVGSPATDPMRYFPPSEKVNSATSFPSRGLQTPFSVPSQCPHSWTSGFHRAAPFTQNQPLGGSPPTYRTSPPSPPTKIYSHRVQNYRPPAHQNTTSHDEYQLSPSFSSSASLSPPTFFSRGNLMQTHIRSETAPVTIPLPLTSRNSRYLSPNFSDPSKNSLPPLSPSPRSTKHDSSSQESPSGIRSYKKTEVSRAVDLKSGIANHYYGQKLARDSKDDSGWFSGLLSSSCSPRIGFSRNSSRLSFQDDLDDCDFSCPFDVDDVDPSDSPASDNFIGKKASECNSQSLPVGRKSQDAAVGVLVQILRTAPPLREDPSCYSSPSLRTTELEGAVGTASGFFMPRKTADALEELMSYREMKDLLRSKSGTLVCSKDEV